MFTVEDAKDDSALKAEVAPDLSRTAKRSSPRIYKHFENVCENMDQEPRMVLSDMLVRSLNNQEFAEQVLETEVTMEAISRGEYKKEDIEMVKDIAETFDLQPDSDGEGKPVVERIIESRIEAVSTSPLDDVSGSRQRKEARESSERVEQLNAEIERLQNEVQELRKKEKNKAEVKKSSGSKKTDDRKDLDELFDDGSEEEPEAKKEEEKEEPKEDEGDEESEVEVEIEDDGLEAGPSIEEEDSSIEGIGENGGDDFDPEVK